MLTRVIDLRVRYYETDMMGVVHHSNYIRFYEMARTEMMRGISGTYKALEDEGIMMPVIEVSSKYHAPAYYDDVLSIKTTLTKIPTVRMIFEYEITNQNGELLNTGTVQLAYMHTDTRKACRAPKWFIDLITSKWEE